MEKSKIPRLLYAGTNREYFYNRLISVKGFMGTPTRVEEQALDAIGEAKKRAEACRDSPILIVIDPKKLEDKLYYLGWWRIRALNIGSFLPYVGLYYQNGHITKESYEGIRLVEEAVLNFSKKKIKEYLTEELSRFSLT